MLTPKYGYCFNCCSVYDWGDVPKSKIFIYAEQQCLRLQCENLVVSCWEVIHHYKNTHSGIFRDKCYGCEHRFFCFTGGNNGYRA